MTRTAIIRLPRKAEGSAGHAGQARHGARLHGHLCVRDAVPGRPAAARCRRSEARAAISARTSSPISSRTAKPWRIASPRPACARTSEAEAYWRDVGTVDAYWEANIDLTDVVPALDLYDHDWPIWTYAEVTPPAKFVHDEDGRRGQAVSLAGLRRLHRLGRGVAAHRCCSPACASIPTRTLEEAVVLPYVEYRPQRAAEAGRHRSRRRDSRRARRRRRSELDAKRFRRTENGICLITQPMIDKLAA